MRPPLVGRTHQGAESAVRYDRRWLAFSGQRVSREADSPDRERHHLSRQVVIVPVAPVEAASRVELATAMHFALDDPSALP